MKSLVLFFVLVSSLNGFAGENPYLLFRDIDKGLSTLDLSYQNICFRTAAKIENGITRLDVDRLRDICRILGLKMNVKH